MYIINCVNCNSYNIICGISSNKNWKAYICNNSSFLQSSIVSNVLCIWKVCCVSIGFCVIKYAKINILYIMKYYLVFLPYSVGPK